MARQFCSILSCVLSVGMGLGAAPQAFAQTQINEAPPAQPAPVVVQQPAPAQAPTTVVNVDKGGGGTAPQYGLRLLGSGAAMFGVSYAVTVITAAAVSDVCNADSALGCRDAAWPLYIPVVGPFIQMGYVSGNGSNTAKALLGIDGVVQGAGLAMMIAGAVMTAQERAGRQARYTLAPYAGGGGIGLVGAGRF